ncbi:MAG: RnfABCDGE type electron transport complex subunit D [Gammaproteobacteria bacterium]|nr:RnfABCDGE type electron transport complex subunit D [Gammaproteobacteria bacterium]
MKFIQAGAPHIHRARTVAALMREVVLALLPAILLHTWFFGPGLIFNTVIAITFALLGEALMLRLRKQSVGLFLGDYTAVLTAVLLAFALPPLTPWWVTASATLFAIIVAKHLYGGLGSNIFNPAMAGYAVVLVSFPAELALWTAPGAGMASTAPLTWYQTLTTTLTGTLPETLTWDQITGATPLDRVQTGLTNGEMLSEIIAGSTLSGAGANHWIIINLAVAAGGIWLLFRKIISWHIPVALLGALFLIAMVFRLADPDSFSSPWFHLFSGSAMAGAFFIATDPVSAATSNQGRLIYAAGIGLLIYIIRTWGSYPDGVAFAVLLMNMLVPLIDYYCVPRTYGHR